MRVVGVNICSFWRDRLTVEPNRRRMTPCEKSKSIPMPGSCWKRTVPAIAEAAQNAIELESNGEMELARTWRHIEDAMKIMRGPHQG